MARRAALGIDGLCIVDKPAGWTSHDVVAKTRGLLGTRKVGHSGTLDPDATGVLLLGVGRATRLLRFLTALGKSYVGEVVLGTETSTLDVSGEVTATYDMAEIGLAEIRAAAAGFVGEIWQVPPMVSAVKVGGRRLHELARAGVEVERPARPVIIGRLVVGPVVGPGVVRIEVDCSSGTYIRTLAADLGAALGGGAHLRNLRRTAVGSFSETEARPLETPQLLAMAVALRDYPAVHASSEEHTDAVAHGRRLPAPSHIEAGPCAVVGADGSLIAVYERQGTDWLTPLVVLQPSEG